MSDVHEDILVRLHEIVATIPNIRSAHRNNISVDETLLPAAVVLDGAEDTNGASDFSNRPSLVQFTPEIMIIAQDDTVGSSLSIMRRELIKRIMMDTELNEQIVKTTGFGNGTIRYIGCQVGTAWLRSLHGAMQAQFLFRYHCLPNDL
jgi:hypothetical protein